MLRRREEQARYKGSVYTALVGQNEAGEVRYFATNEAGEVQSQFKSPSAAGAAIMGEGRTCNGWAFWSTGEPTEKLAKEPKVLRPRR
jgi:hypothetical protein